MRQQVKISELGDFQGKKLLLQAQKRGVEILGPHLTLDASPVILIGLVNLLVEKNILKE